MIKNILLYNFIYNYEFVNETFIYRLGIRILLFLFPISKNMFRFIFITYFLRCISAINYLFSVLEIRGIKIYILLNLIIPNLFKF